MSYLEKRQNPLTDRYVKDIEFAFAKISERFDQTWLESDSGNHSLQQLWQRCDALSTIELFTFGSALIAAEQASAKWLSDQVKLVRGNDENNQRGAVFEILVVGAAAPRQKVTPARANQPGYDADIATTRGTTYRTSLKRYSQSAHEKLFLKKSNNTELRFINALRKTRFDALLYVKANNYPSESNWQNLYAEIDQLVSNFNGIKQIVEIEGFWLVGLLPLAEENDEVFSKNHNSYSFVCASPYHNNEQQNFTSKLESAVSNLERHVVTGSDYVPIIIMQLPVTACALTLTNWTNEYINKNSESALEAVFFLQPFTASNEGGASSHIAHFTSVACSQSFRKESRQMLQLDFPVGIITQTPPHWKLHSDIGETQLLNHYVYQKGRHFITAQQDSSGASSANISRKAPGIESIAVFELYGQQMVLQGSFGEDLCLIGG